MAKYCQFEQQTVIAQSFNLNIRQKNLIIAPLFQAIKSSTNFQNVTYMFDIIVTKV